MMKRICLTVGLVFATFAHATVDGIAEMTIPTWDDGYEGFVLRKVPYIGCYGIPGYTSLSAFFSAYNVPSTGCGLQNKVENLNLAACAMPLDVVFDDKEINVKSLTIDIGGCQKHIKEGPKFKEILAKAALKTLGVKLSAVKIVDGDARNPASVRRGLKAASCGG